MNTNAMARLLTELLDPQVESGEYGEIGDDRLRKAMTIGPALTKQEQSLLLLSPVARADYSRVCNEIVAETRDRITRHGVKMNLLPLAAADQDDKVVFKSTGFTVTLYRRDDLGIPWIILVQLGSSYRQAINPMTTVRLADTGGLEWLRGKPDANGELTGAWNDSETNLLTRAQRFSLMLEPV